jgi:hypothetical protein
MCQFTLLTPTDRGLIDFAIFISVGVHEHSLPAPQKTPFYILKPIINLIQRMNNPGLTLSELKTRY